MKKLTNKQRCRKCIHKVICGFKDYYYGLEGIERCNRYFNKERIKEKRRGGCVRCNHGKAFYCSDGKRIYIGADGSVTVYVNGEYIDIPANFKFCPWCGVKMNGEREIK